MHTIFLVVIKWVLIHTKYALSQKGQKVQVQFSKLFSNYFLKNLSLSIKLQNETTAQQEGCLEKIFSGKTTLF